MGCWRGLPLPLGTWGVKTSQRVSFFDLKVAQGKMLISYNLRRRGFSIVDWCCMCPCNGESVNYCLINCGRAHQSWSFALRSFRVAWVMPKRVIDHWSFDRMEKLTGETSVHYVELNTFMFYMVYMEGEEQAYIWGCGELRRTAPCFIHRNFIWSASGLGTHIHGHCFMVFLHKVVKQKKRNMCIAAIQTLSN